MIYTKEQRIDIGRQVYAHEISHADAEKKYGVVKTCIDRYIREYKKHNGIPTETRAEKPEMPALEKRALSPDIEAYKTISKDESLRVKVDETLAGSIPQDTLEVSAQTYPPTDWFTKVGVNSYFDKETEYWYYQKKYTYAPYICVLDILQWIRNGPFPVKNRLDVNMDDENAIDSDIYTFDKFGQAYPLFGLKSVGLSLLNQTVYVDVRPYDYEIVLCFFMVDSLPTLELGDIVSGS